MATKTKRLASQPAPESVKPSGPAPEQPRPATTLIYLVAMVLLLGFGFGLRCYHITEPPLDFHAQRQYWDACRARLMYYQSLQGTDQQVPSWQMDIARNNAEAGTEPPIMETLAVYAYRLAGHEDLALPRAISALLYVLGGLFLFLLAARLFPLPGAFAALGYYLFLPFTVQSTRTFQPDPMMTAWVVASLYFLYRYYEKQTIKRISIALPFVALALFCKPMSIFFIAVPFALLMLGRLVEETRWFSRRIRLGSIFPPLHVLLFIATIVVGLAWYLVDMLKGGSVAGQAGKSFFPELFRNPRWWQQYWKMIGPGTLQYWALIGGALGVIFSPRRSARWLLLGGWIGYAIYFYRFNYHVQSHVYYNLPLVPIVGLSLGALVGTAARLIQEKLPSFRIAAGIAFGILLVGLLAAGSVLAARKAAHPEFKDFQAIFEQIGDQTGHTRHAVIFSMGYGYPMRYHGLMSGVWWPTAADLAAEQLRTHAVLSAADRLQQDIKAGAEYFIATADMGSEIANQLDLQHSLDNYTMIAYTRDYWIIDLRRPKLLPAHSP